MAADIGITANEVERNLDTLFTLSQRWRCVLLFDEAEIVLQARTREDMQRNSIVSGTNLQVLGLVMVRSNVLQCFFGP
jgi:hypothetical protein